jgi:NAD(P)-dependent dehydrogenase (short-subunit alcohol dehydrogenase family)
VGALAGKSIVITGAGAGLGKAYAEHAAGEGASMILNDVSPDVEQVVREINDRNGQQARAVASIGDVGDWAYTDGLVEECVQRFGRIDGIVSNAGRYYHALPWEETEERLRQLYSTNVLGTLFCGVHAMRRMVAQGSGSIVNVTSGSHVGIPGLTAYGGTKGSVSSLTYGWALELKEHGVRVNAVSPRARTHDPDDPAAGDVKTGSLWSAHRAGPLVSFLLSDLSRDLNGQVIRMSGRELSVMSHPWETQRSMTRDEWSMADIAQAFDGELGAGLRPVGLTAAASRT